MPPTKRAASKRHVIIKKSVTRRKLATPIIVAIITGAFGVAGAGIAVLPGMFSHPTSPPPKPSPVKIALSQQRVSLPVGADLTLDATVSPPNATNAPLAWSSSEPAVASVDANGVVKGLADGMVTIKVTTSDPSVHAICIVMVGTTITTFAGNGTPDYSGDGGRARAGQVGPASLVCSPANTPFQLYIADSYNDRIRKVDAQNIITTIVGTGTNGYSGDDGPAILAKLNDPTSVAVDSAGNLYIADTGNNRVREVEVSGIITTVAGTGKAGYSGDGGPATKAKLDGPTGVAIDSAHNLYVADAGNNRIRKITASGTIATVAGTGKAGYSGDGGPAGAAKLNDPAGVAIDSADTLYIADFGNNRVREITFGNITTFAGTGKAGYSGDGGPARSAELYGPVDIAIDSVHNLYIDDTGNNCVRRVSSTGTITTIVGTGTAGYSGDEGPARSAELNSPYGVALSHDLHPALYIADYSNSRVRIVLGIR